MKEDKLSDIQGLNTMLEEKWWIEKGKCMEPGLQEECKKYETCFKAIFIPF